LLKIIAMAGIGKRKAPYSGIMPLTPAVPSTPRRNRKASITMNCVSRLGSAVPFAVVSSANRRLRRAIKP
jgi:hypothetical protein